MSSIRKIAKQCEVSTATVSRALRNDPRVSGETAEKIQVAASALGYRPNPLAGRLMSQYRRNDGEVSLGGLAILLDTSSLEQIHLPATMQLFVRGIERVAGESGYHLNLFALSAQTPRRLETILRSRGIEGILVGPRVHAGKGILRVPSENFKTVIAGWGWEKPSYNRVATDHAYSMRTVLRHLRHRFGKSIAALVPEAIDRRCDHALKANFIAHHPAGVLAAQKLYFNLSEAGIIACRSAMSRGAFKSLIISHADDLNLLREHLGFSDLIFVSLNGPLSQGDRSFGHLDECADRIGAWATQMLLAQLARGESGVPEKAKIILAQADWKPSLL